MRQIFHMKKVIEKRINEDRNFQAKLANKEIKGANLEPLKISAEKRKEYDNDAKALLARMKKGYSDRSRTDNKD